MKRDILIQIHFKSSPGQKKTSILKAKWWQFPFPFMQALMWGSQARWEVCIRSALARRGPPWDIFIGRKIILQGFWCQGSVWNSAVPQVWGAQRSPRPPIKYKEPPAALCWTSAGSVAVVLGKENQSLGVLGHIWKRSGLWWPFSLHQTTDYAPHNNVPVEPVGPGQWHPPFAGHWLGSQSGNKRGKSIQDFETRSLK